MYACIVMIKRPNNFIHYSINPIAMLYASEKTQHTNTRLLTAQIIHATEHHNPSTTQKLLLGIGN